MTTGQLLTEAAVALFGSLLGAGVPAMIIGFKLAAAWGGLIERVSDLEESRKDHNKRIRVVEQRGYRPGVGTGRRASDV